MLITRRVAVGAVINTAGLVVLSRRAFAPHKTGHKGKLGVLAPLGSPVGTDAAAGAEVARDLANEGALPPIAPDSIDLMIIDSTGGPDKAAEAARGLVPEVEALIVADFSASTLAAAEAAAEFGLVSVAAFQQLAWPEEGFGGQAFADAGTDLSIAIRLAEGLAALRETDDAFAGERWALYHNPQLDRQAIDALTASLQELGVEEPALLSHGEPLSDQVDAILIKRTSTPEQFQSLLQSPLASAAKLILVEAGLEPLDSLAARAPGMTIHAYALYDSLHAPLTTDFGDTFRKRFEERTGRQPSPAAALSATAVQIVAIALAQLGEGDVGELGAALLALSLEQGNLIAPWGLQFENFVNVMAQPFIVRISNGEIESLWP